jgi:hypothetical protein
MSQTKLWEARPGWYALQQYHLDFPEAGDYWMEMFMGCYIVLGVTDTEVIVCSEKIDVDNDHYTFDIDRTKRFTFIEWRCLLSYFGKDKTDTWCELSPKKHLDFREEAIARGIDVGREHR